MSVPQASDLRARLGGSLLARSGGALVVPLLDRSMLHAFDREARMCRTDAEPHRVEQHDGEEDRGGAPDRWLESALGGPELRALYTSASVAELLISLTAVRWTPSGGAGTYSYYCRTGHYLGLHRDVVECDLALIVCISDSGAASPCEVGTLCVYPGRADEPLSKIRAEPARGSVGVRLRPGEAALLLGGVVPHCVTPTAPGQVRVVAPLCFSAVE
jgi:hypothetical protein